MLDFALICDIFYLGKVQSYGAVLLFRVHACMCVYVCVCVFYLFSPYALQLDVMIVSKVNS